VFIVNILTLRTVDFLNFFNDIFLGGFSTEELHEFGWVETAFSKSLTFGN
jgi:hypothetical protein